MQNNSRVYYRFSSLTSTFFSFITILLITAVITLSFTSVYASDTDGIPDALDLDSDNDGILDSVECTVDAIPGAVDGPVTTGVTFDVTSADPNNSTGIHTLNALTINGSTYSELIVPDAYRTALGSIADNTSVAVLQNGIEQYDYSSPTYDTDTLNVFQSHNLNYYQRLDSDDFTNATYTISYNRPLIVSRGSFIAVMERGGNNPYQIQAINATSALIGTPITVASGTGTYIDTGYRINTANTQTAHLAIYPLDDFAPTGTLIYGWQASFPTANTDGPDGKIFAVSLNQPCDQDGDGITNDLDLDSDNDGISDLVEAGLDPTLYDPDNNGVIDGAQFVDNDNDGLADSLETMYGTDTAHVPVDSDGDQLVDTFDLDSDNDGVPDTVEAYPTLDYETIYGNDGNVTDDDTDNDGVVNSFDPNDSTTGLHGGIFPPVVNTDGDTIPDYLDTNSDNDALSDTAESGLILSGQDLNFDGADDAVVTSYPDPNGIVDNPGLSLDNEFGDINEVAYREAPTAAVTLLKTVASSTITTPAEVGQLISYQFLITNTGTATTTAVTLEDQLLGGDITATCSWPGANEVLPAGASTTCIASDYSITAADIAAGFVENTATITINSLAGTSSDISDAGNELVETADGTGNTDSDPTNDPTVVVLTAPEDDDTTEPDRSRSTATRTNKRDTTKKPADPEPVTTSTQPEESVLSAQLADLLNRVWFLKQLQQLLAIDNAVAPDPEKAGK